MSETRFKFAVCGHVPGLDNASWTEAYAYFKEKLGAAPEVDEYDGNIDYFSYFPDRKTVNVLGARPSTTSGITTWGYEYVLEDCELGDEDRPGVSLGEIDRICRKLWELDVCRENIQVVAYTWYTGVDEPCDFQVKVAK